MMRIVKVVLVALFGGGVLLLPGDTQAGSCRVVIQNQQVIVPFAVPVAVPVAVSSGVLYTAQPAYYGYGQQQQQVTNEAQLEALADRIAARLEQRLRAQQTVGLVGTHCATCHSGANPLKGFSLEGELSAETRLRALTRITHPDDAKRMPFDASGKHKPLAPEVLGTLIHELSSMPVTAPLPLNK